MYGLNNYPTQPLPPWGDEASRQMNRPYGYPPRPQRSWGDEASQQLGPKLLQLDMAIPEHPSHDSSLTDDKRKEVCQTQSTAVDALMRAIQAKPAGDSSSEAAAGEKRARRIQVQSHIHAPTPPARTRSPNSATSKPTSVGTPASAPSPAQHAARLSSIAAMCAPTPLSTTPVVLLRNSCADWMAAGSASRSWGI
ncbi:hypothetical protein V501_01015 [Pseudogymnoascus sp. VKM F-4519 (FW-2642)]|nr:hypothetical protein V501_01015 [Pseudogymnoascus sp. VKM F-4519 (FW-2642)]